MEELKKGQRRAARMIHGMEGLPYEETLKRFSLEMSCLRVYKILTIEEKVNRDLLLALSHRATIRGHKRKRVGGQFKTSKRRFFSPQWVRLHVRSCAILTAH